MDNRRRIWLWGLVVEQAVGGSVGLDHLCAAAISALHVDFAAIAVAVSAAAREMVFASDPIAADLEELALTLGEGPGVDAVTDGLVLVADLTDPRYLSRWPIFAPAALQAGVRAAYALPLQVGGICLGVMDLYSATPGVMTGEQLADALLLADTACALLLDVTGHARSEGSGPEPAGGQHPEVHQATGMLIVQLGVSAAVAMTRLRAHSYAHNRRLRDVAADVVARRLRFESD